MRRAKLNFGKFHSTNLMALAGVAILLAAWFPVASESATVWREDVFVAGSGIQGARRSGAKQ